MNSLPRLAVEQAWRTHINRQPSTNRWVWGTNGPVRQKPLRPVPENFERIFREDNRWMLEKGGKRSWILIIEEYVNVFNTEWLTNRNNFPTARAFGDFFAAKYSGVIRGDVEFLIKMIHTQQIPQPSQPQAPQRQIPLRNVPNQPQRIQSPPPTNPPPSVSSIWFPEAGKEQVDLYNDERRFELLENFRNVRDGMRGKTADQETHLERLSQQGLFLFNNGRPAVPWTVGMQEDKIPEADYLLLTETQHIECIRRGILDKPVVVRDEGFRTRRPGMTRDEFFNKLKMNPGKKVHVQDLSLPITELSARAAGVIETIETWRNPPVIFSNTNPPINLLNISDKTDGVTPLGIIKEYSLLQDACMYAYGDHIGKQHVESIAADLSNCIKFRIMAQRGSVSGFHIDSCGVVTWVTLEPISNEVGSDRMCVKYWFIIPLNLLSREERDQAMKDFARNGRDWQPSLRIKFPSITLIAGDTLIMPPGTIHAPVTLTDCFFVGGMCMHPRILNKTLEIWQYLSRYQHCTNESQPLQARGVLDYFHNSVIANPSKFGYTKDMLPDFNRICNELVKRTFLTCSCKRGCEGKCNCNLVGQRCGPRCHNGTPCKNPSGSHKAYSSS